MNDTEKEILGVLNELENAVADIRAQGAKPDLQAMFARLDDLSAMLPAGSNPMLAHFLQKKSYEKARELLAGADAPRRGWCGGR